MLVLPGGSTSALNLILLVERYQRNDLELKKQFNSRTSKKDWGGSREITKMWIQKNPVLRKGASLQPIIYAND